METTWLLLLIAYLLLFAEIILPGGVLGVIGGVMLLIASISAFQSYGVLVGTAVFVFGGIGAAVLFYLEIKLLTRSPLGKIFVHSGQVEGFSKDEEEAAGLEGKTGVVLTALNPSGKVEVEGKVIQARSIEGWIDAGESVEVVGGDVFKAEVRKKTTA